MEILERYLQAVRKFLPKNRQEDIVAELRGNLESQLEEREAELGRPLSAKEAEEWIKQFGPSVALAAKYQPVQYLIGPSFFPMYWYVLKLAFYWSLVIYLVVSGVILALGTQDAHAVADAIFRVPVVLLQVAMWVTLVFAFLEYAATHKPEWCPPQLRTQMNWNPAELPALEKTKPVKGVKPRSYAQAVAEVVFGFLFLAWLLIIPSHPFWLMGPGIAAVEALPYKLSPVWWQFYWWAVALNVLQLVWRCVILAIDEWQGPQLIRHLVEKTAGLMLVAVLLNAPQHLLVVLKNPAVDEAKYAATLYQINETAHMGLKVMCALVVVGIVIDLAKDWWKTRQLQARMLVF